MNTDSTSEMPERPNDLTTTAADEEGCRTVCYHPECACRERTIAGCSLPLAPVQIKLGNQRDQQ